jgi:hypothetical protein
MDVDREVQSAPPLSYTKVQKAEAKQAKPTLNVMYWIDSRFFHGISS